MEKSVHIVMGGEGTTSAFDLPKHIQINVIFRLSLMYYYLIIVSRKGDTH